MNLWTDLDNSEQQQLDTARPGRPQRPRRPTEHAIFSDLRAWLLQDYVSTYCRSLGATRIFRRCYWIDALGLTAKARSTTLPADESRQGEQPEPAPTTPSGKGRKKNGAQSIPPALQPIVNLSQALGQESKPITLHGLLLEGGSSQRHSPRHEAKAAQNGTAKIAELSLPKESAILRASWLEAAPQLLKEIEPSPAIFLLNPFGHTLFTYDDLALLYQRAVPTELCLLIPHKQLEARLLKASNTPALATLLTSLLRSDRWRSLPIKAEEMAPAIDGFINLFIASMQRSFPQPPVQRIALFAQTGPALVEALPYTFIFATRRQDSLMSMNDAVCSYRRRINAYSHQGTLAEAWFAQQERERTETHLQQLYQDTLQQGKASRIRRWPDLRQKLLLAHFGQFLQSDYDTIIQQLLLDQAVRCEWRKPANSEEAGLQIPGNDDTLFWR